MIFTNFAVEKKSNIFSEGSGNFISSPKRKNEKNYCLTNLNKLSEERGTQQSNSSQYSAKDG
jgi:hypothetical protein